MKIHILHELKQGPWGGGNQFLKNLKRHLQKEGSYAANPEKADAILFNSHHNLWQAFRLKIKRPEIVFIHRVDGPLYLVRGSDRATDKLIYYVNRKIADGTIFQSEFSRRQNQLAGHKKTSPETIVHNSPDHEIFTRGRTGKHHKIRLISTSWSSNWRKGFATYQYLDSNLDFSRYEYLFVGNSPVKFKNITMIPPLSSKDLAEELRKSDIFITASKADPCSNSLIEALSCGLPAVALAEGGHPELIGQGGELFRSPKEAIDKITKVEKSLDQYRKRTPSFEAPSQYVAFIKSVKSVKRPRTIDIMKFAARLVAARLEAVAWRMARWG